MKRIVIAPYLAHQNLYEKYRKDDPFCDVKFFSKSSLLKEAYYQYSDEAIIYLIKKYNLDYSLANNYLSYIKKLGDITSNNDKIKHLIDIKNDLLSNNLLFKNDYLNYELSQGEIDIYFYTNEDKELLSILKDKNYKFIKSEEKGTTKFYNFPSSIDELIFVFNKISKLISEGANPNDINVYGLSESDELSFLRLKENFYLNFNNAYPKNFLHKNFVSKFVIDLIDVGVEQAFQTASAYNSDDEVFEEFRLIVERFKIEGISPQNQSNLYKEIFSKKRLENPIFKEAINVVNEPIAKEGKYLFILNFTQGKFPPIIRDNGYLSNKEKASIGLATTDDENHANLELFNQYLQQNANIYVTYSNRSYSEKYSPSPFIKLLNLDPIKDEKIFDYYSLNEAKISYANLLDLRINYLDNNPLLLSFQKSGIKINYRDYDYRFNGTAHFAKDVPLTVSYSKIKTYCECQYKFYLDRVLKLDEIEPNISLTIGTLAHNIFERIGTNKPFEELFDEEYRKVANQFNQNDWVYLFRIKDEIHKTFDYIVQFENQIDNSKIERETSGVYKNNLIQLDNQTLLEGRIDKTISFGKNSDYLFIIDYKSGYEEYKPDLVEYGLSLQLPTYALIAKEGNRFSNKKLAGLFTQRILASKEVTSFIEPNKDETPLLEGVFLNDVSVIRQADKSIIDSNSSKFIRTCRVKNDGTFNSKRAKSMEYFEEISENARNIITKSVHSILSNEFAINPKIVGGNDKSCTYCPYRDICYRDYHAFEILSNEGDAQDESD